MLCKKAQTTGTAMHTCLVWWANLLSQSQMMWASLLQLQLRLLIYIIHYQTKLLQAKQAVPSCPEAGRTGKQTCSLAQEATASRSVAACHSICSQCVATACAALQPCLALCTLHDVLQAGSPTHPTHPCLEAGPQPAAPSAAFPQA